MIKNYFKIAWRNLLKSKGYSAINIGGLAVGMAVAMMIGLWIWDELSFHKYHKNYDRIAQVMQHQTYNGLIGTQTANPAVMANEIRTKYGSDFKYVLQSSWNNHHTLSIGDKKIYKSGSYWEPGVVDMLSLRILKGSAAGFNDPHSIIISETIAEAFFGNDNPIEKTIKLDNKEQLKVIGVYENIPHQSKFREMYYIMPWSLYLINEPWVGKMTNPWGSNFTQTYAQIADNANMEKVSAKIKKIKQEAAPDETRNSKPEVFLHPMKNWHLHNDWKNGINAGGRIKYVWLFGIVGLFVLLLACINFMNLSTARSEKRAREVGVRKAIGSTRKQLIYQFFSESFLIVLLACMVAIGLVLLALPFFNEVADKKIAFFWTNPWFWLACLVFSLLTGVIAGSYPALYLSSFQPVRVLKGTFQAGRFAAIPRKVLVVMQFAVSVMLIIGTIVVYRQIQHAKNRPIGYDKRSLVTAPMNGELHKQFEALRQELKTNNLVVDITQATSPTTDVWNTNGGFNWEGKDPNMSVDFPNSGVTPEYGKVVGWKIIEGRDFSRDFKSDTAAFILNETAVKFIGLKDPVGKTLVWDDRPFQIIGIVEDILTQSPYQPVRASLFHCSNEAGNVVIMKINPNLAAGAAVKKIEAVFKKFDPGTAYEFNFVDEDFAQKFGDEERIGKLAGVFAVLAIFISCLGLLGLASFVAEQRTKEIGIRKVIGASVFNVWYLLSKEFVLLVTIACVIAVPLGWYSMRQWLQEYDYRTTLNWWIFGAAIAGALGITIATVSFQAIKAALSNPVKSLRSE
ncbi:MAG TPA: ABC transporter permease [Phnomibacter sp.]|nr:ABC transporter permease [Phnomibacter sp.]